MRRFWMLLSVLCLLAVPMWVLAQEGPPPPMGGNNAGNGMREEFAKFREAHKYTFQLQDMTRNIGQMVREKKTPLTAAQAKAILVVLKPLRTKATLTQDDAKNALKGLKKALTVAQLNELAKMKPDHGPARGGPHGGPNAKAGQGAPGGKGGQGAARPRFDPAKMKNFNPFNPAKDSPMYERSIKRWNLYFEMLDAVAAGKPVPAAFMAGPEGEKPAPAKDAAKPAPKPAAKKK